MQLSLTGETKSLNDRLTNVQCHDHEDKQPKPAIESNYEVHDCHSNVNKCRKDSKQKIAKAQILKTEQTLLMVCILARK